MDKIEFHSVIPNVFANSENRSSELWRKDVTLERDRVYLIEAASGKGKSTFCSYIIGYRNDYSGKISFDDTDIRDLKVRDWVDIRSRHISYLFQELRLFPELTAYENIAIKNNITGYKTRKDIVEWFEMLGIADKLDSKIGRMSYGQQQRVAMIRALVQPFDFILADEPISHLDDNNSKIMGEIMMTEAKRQGAGIIVTSIGKHIDLDYEKTLRL